MNPSCQKRGLRDLLLQMAVYGTGDVFLKLTGLITVPIYTRIFTPNQYGVWNVVVTIVGLVGTLLAFGGNTTYCRFFFDAKTSLEKRMVTSTWCIFMALWSFTAIGLCLLLSPALSQWSLGTDEHSILFQLSLAAVPIGVFNETAGQVLRNDFRAKLFSALNILSVALTVTFSLYGAVGLKLGLVGVMAGTAAAAVVMLPVRLWTVRSMLQLSFSLTVLRRMLLFGTPLVPTTVAYWVFGLSDRVLLGKLSTLDQVGLYGIAASVASAIGILNGALGQAWAPIALKRYEEDKEEASVFFGRVMTYILLGFGLMCIVISTFAEEIVGVFASPAFYGASSAVGPLALAVVASSTIQITALGISLRMKTKYFALYSWLAAVVNLALNFVFIPKWGMLAAGWTTVISFGFLSAAYFVTSQRLWAVQYQRRQVLLILAATIGFTLGLSWVPDLRWPWDVVCKAFYILAYLAVLLALGVIDLREWSGLVGAKRRVDSIWMKAKV